MDTNQLAEYIDQQRWLLNNGLVPDSVKNQLFFYGSIVHKDVQAVEVAIHAEEKNVEYTIYFKKDMLKKISKHKELSTATSLFGMWQFKRFLKKEGSMNFHNMLNQFVQQFCGPKWTTKLTIADFDVYVDSIGEDSGTDEPSPQHNKLPD